MRDYRDVAERQLCTGCGACAFAEPDRVRIVDDLDQGRRPVVVGPPAGRAALERCPGRGIAHDGKRARDGEIASLRAAWGPVLEVYEGHAADADVRHAGSSGGAATALALFGIERGGMHGALHVAAREDRPWLNRTVLSRDRAGLLRGAGSRYAPASPADGLDRIRTAPGPCVFVGKPCDVAAADRARRADPRLDARLGLLVAFFCAGTPSARGTLDLIRKSGFSPENVASVRYRGRGWPGRWTVTTRAGDTADLSYEDSWGFLERYRQWRCHVCADHSGEFADVSVGDPWYRAPRPGEPGRSLVLVRTERGRRYVRAAVEAGYLALEPAEPSVVDASQPNLLKTRGALWGRLLALRLMGVPAPRYRGFPMFRFWLTKLDTKEKMQSILGTMKRVFRRGLLRRHPVVEGTVAAGARPSREKAAR